ncbi:hypothetical protein DFJ67_0910 [Asanoa ferruginea]|uniref:Uncharacterized protein n=1 Tax=Asanoa ferruginea TaxID=53367 RepID=A0A3D9ZGG3_9ACTN|nr:hypothetical protein [Asanoa ferruginea]REF94963.1 hypothetical protein DFJ67_0910 [Asanoa ferruginea]GIF48772.1 hypothetical protein Afe04nite_33110 [Asanoa ferruginea]
MHLVKVKLRSDDLTSAATSEPIVTDLIWVHADPDAGVEHVRVWIQPDAMVIALFICSAAESRAQDVAAALMKRILNTPAMRGWHSI